MSDRRVPSESISHVTSDPSAATLCRSPEFHLPAVAFHPFTPFNLLPWEPHQLEWDCRCPPRWLQLRLRAHRGSRGNCAASHGCRHRSRSRTSGGSLGRQQRLPPPKRRLPRPQAPDQRGRRSSRGCLPGLPEVARLLSALHSPAANSTRPSDIDYSGLKKSQHNFSRLPCQQTLLYCLLWWSEKRSSQVQT